MQGEDREIDWDAYCKMAWPSHIPLSEEVECGN